MSKYKSSFFFFSCSVETTQCSLFRRRICPKLHSQKETKQKQHKVHAGHLESGIKEASDAEARESGKELTMECPRLGKDGEYALSS